VVKVNATAVTPWGIRLGTALSWQSGLPYTVLHQRFSRDNRPPPARSLYADSDARPRQIYVDGLRNTGRNEGYWNVDVRATKELTLGRNLDLQVSAEVYNLLDDGTYQVWNPTSEDGQQVNGVNEAYYRFGRRFQLGLKLAF
jgi:hypothetical protein